MTPQEKAKLLYQAFSDAIPDAVEISKSHIKDIAIISVNEIINCNANEDFGGHFRDDYIAVPWWEEVKDEIEKL